MMTSGYLNRNWLALGIGIVGAALFLALQGGPVSNDELKYLEVSIAPERQAFVLNRYAHIYLQAFFVHLSPDPVTGARIFWALSGGVALAATFLSAMLLTGSRSPLPGLAAVLMLLTQNAVFRYVGTTYADFTVMTLVACGMAVYLLDSRHARLTALILGGLLVLALRSKETGVVLLALAPFFLPQAERRLGLPASFGYWFLGGVIIQAALMTVDAFALGDFWWSLRPSSIAELLAFNVGDFEHTAGNWFAWIAMSEVAVPFACFLLTLPLLAGEAPRRLRLLAWTPFALMLFLGIAGLNGNWGIIPRYYAPVLPVICAVAAVWLYRQGLGREPLLQLFPPRLLALMGLAITALALAGWLLRSQSSTLNLGSWTPYMLLQSLVYPLFLIALISVFLFVPSGAWQRRATLLVILAGLAPMLAALPNSLSFANRVYTQRSYPLAAFAGQMQFRKDAKYQISPSLWLKYNMLESPERMIRVFSGVLIPFENFTLSEAWPPAPGTTYVLASVTDLERWKSAGVDLPVLHIKGKAVLLCPSGC
jgi:hypothetical protein